MDGKSLEPLLGASEIEISKAVKAMYTDPNHLRIEQPGQVEGNVVFTYLDAFHSDSHYVQQLKDHYRAGGLGDGTCKKILEECLQETLKPIREARQTFIEDKAQLLHLLKQGTDLSRQHSEQTLKRVKSAFGLDLF